VNLDKLPADPDRATWHEHGDGGGYTIDLFLHEIAHQFFAEHEDGFGKASYGHYHTSPMMVSYVDEKSGDNNCGDHIDSKNGTVYSPISYSDCAVSREFPDSSVKTVNYDNV